MMTAVPGSYRPSGVLAIQSSLARISGNVLAAQLSAVLAGTIGALLVVKPLFAVLPLLGLGAVLLLASPHARITFLVFGGLLALQSSQGLDLVKLAYLAGVLVSFAAALFSLSQRRNDPPHTMAVPLLRLSLVFFLLLIVSWPIASAHGVARTDWLRDVAPYVLFASAPVFALDAQSSLSRRTLLRLLLIAGSFATLSFAINWLNLRQIASLPISRVALSSFFFPAALFAYGAAASLQGRARRIRWLALTSLIFALLLVTGTRSTFVLLFIPLAIAIGARRYFVVRSLRLAVLAPVLLVLALGTAYSVVVATGASTKILSERISILKGTGSQSSDASYNDRVAQFDAAWNVFKENPVFGGGPGTTFSWVANNGEKNSSFILDTSMTFPAKFGVVGLAVVAFLISCWVAFLRSLCSFKHPRTETLALIGLAAVAIPGALLTTPFEDKGFTLGLTLVLALALRTYRPAASPRERGDRAALFGPGG
jgi:O-antigen ligase